MEKSRHASKQTWACIHSSMCVSVCTHVFVCVRSRNKTKQNKKKKKKTSIARDLRCQTVLRPSLLVDYCIVQSNWMINGNKNQIIVSPKELSHTRLDVG